MGKIVKLILLVAVVLLIWKKGLPFIQSYGFTLPGAPGELNTEGWGCVRQVEAVREQLGETLSRARPGEPTPFLDKLRDEQETAQILCRCESLGCAEGKEALFLTESMITEVADPTRVGEAAMKGARNLEQLDGILARATAAARSATE